MSTTFTRTSDDLITSWQLRLKQQLKADGISYRELASRMRTTDAIISKHLNGQTQQESLTFIKRVCEASGYHLHWALFGSSEDSRQSACPWLTRLGIKQWMDTSHRNKSRMEARYIKGWFNFPDDIQLSSNGFVWQIGSSELESFGMDAGSWLVIDPARELLKRSVGRSTYHAIGEPLVLVRLNATNGLMICKMQTIADQVWFRPPSGHMASLLQDDLTILGKVVAGLRDFDALSSPHLHTITD